MVLYLAQDLVWGTRIKSTGEAVGVACRPARTVAMLQARLADSPVKGIVLELPSSGAEGEGEGEGGGNQEVWAILDHLAALRTEQPERAIKVVVFGPHVDTEGLRRAKTAGADTVMTRGAFHSRLPEILRSLESATG